jgi:membrane protein DedA with SNARE-associated domain
VSLAELVSTYGYLAVFAGTLLEGETILLLAGFTAHRGHLDFALVLACAAAGATLGDQAWFLVGRRWGAQALARHPRVDAAVARARPLLERWGVWFVVANRFLTGLRIAGPIAVGMTGMHWVTFAAANVAGAVLWAATVGSLGYFLGEGVERVLAGARHTEEAVIGGAALAAAGYALWRYARGRRAAQRTGFKS